jgi:pimeloyl-ACP methyl ester carboxylesterase
MVQQNTNSGFSIISEPTVSIGDDKQLAVFVHGWRMTYSDYNIFSQTMLKRLYWQGYQGKFAALRWPTRSADTDTNLLFTYVPSVNFTYNRSEHIAFKSANGAASFFNYLHQRYPDYKISVAAHSMGNILMMQTLKLLAASYQTPLDNYVLMQAAVPACCYDTTVTNLPLFAQEEIAVPTPNTYSNYAYGIDNALKGTAINFYNPLDYALSAWQINEGFLLSTTNEILTFKPNAFFGYSYNPVTLETRVTTNYWQSFVGVSNVIPRIITDPIEMMPFVARPRSLAVGAQGGVDKVLDSHQEVNLQDQLGFTSEKCDHSGEFNRNIQELQVQVFYTNLLFRLFPSFK